MAISATLRRDWLSNPRADILAGIVVALALIPEAIGFSIIAGVDPRVEAGEEEVADEEGVVDAEADEDTKGLGQQPYFLFDFRSNGLRPNGRTTTTNDKTLNRPG